MPAIQVIPEDSKPNSPPLEASKPTNPPVKPPTPTLKPLALKGLSFLRSRSAPPSPRDSSTIQIPDVKPAAETQTQSVIEGPSLSGDATTPGTANKDDPLNIAPETEGLNVPKKPSGKGSSPAPSAAVSRSTSPAPSLEAILFDRKRRHAQTGVAGGPSTIAAPVPSAPRATGGSKAFKFKSSPLSGAAVKEAGSVDVVDGNGGVDEQELVQESERIQDTKDKEGPDIRD